MSMDDRLELKSGGMDKCITELCGISNSVCMWPMEDLFSQNVFYGGPPLASIEVQYLASGAY